MTPPRLLLVAMALVAALSAPAAARQIEVTGRLDVIQIDDFEHGGSRVVHRLRDDASGNRKTCR